MADEDKWKPYKCIICDKGYGQMKSYEIHLNSHYLEFKKDENMDGLNSIVAEKARIEDDHKNGKDRFYECDGCLQSYRSAWKLREHKESQKCIYDQIMNLVKQDDDIFKKYYYEFYKIRKAKKIQAESQTESSPSKE
jgi:hypothetical protein